MENKQIYPGKSRIHILNAVHPVRYLNNDHNLTKTTFITLNQIELISSDVCSLYKGQQIDTDIDHGSV